MTSVAATSALASRARDVPTAASADLSLADAYAACTAIGVASGSNFVHLFRLLPADRRRGLDALYAFCRLVDDAADVAAGADGVAELAAWRQELTRVFDGVPTHPVGMALADTVHRFDVPREHLLDIIAGVAMDLEQRRYETFVELRRYCHHVAAAVGLATLPILGCRSAESRQYAERLGVGLQLTNILRDLAEDAERGRIYLPREDLARFGYRERDLTTHVANEAFGKLMAFECERAGALFREARARISPVDQRRLAPAEGMRLVYQRLLTRIRRRPEAVFGPRLAVTRAEKMACLLAAWVRSVWRGPS